MAAALAAQTEVDSSTPWMAAAEGNLPLLKSSLLALGLAATAQDETGYALVHAAVSYSQMNVLQWLVDNGANVHAVDNEGDTVLHYSGDAATASYLIQALEVDSMLTNVAGKTALQVKEEELEEIMDDEDDEDDDVEVLKQLVEYLKSL